MDFPLYYHVYNRGLDKRIIFPEDSFRERFLQTTRLARLSKAPQASIFMKQKKLGLAPPESEMESRWGPPSVDILTFCLMPNHFHFLLKELVSGGIAKFMQRLGNGYTKYFNAREEREGRLFTFKYKDVRIETDEQLVHVSRYTHVNPCVSQYSRLPLESLRTYPWTSLPNYLKARRDLICQPEEVLKFFSSPKDYWTFIAEGLGDSLNQLPSQIFIDAYADEIYI